MEHSTKHSFQSPVLQDFWRKLASMQNQYFIGLTLPDELTRQLTGLQDELLASRNMLKPLIPHITLLHPNQLAKLPADDFLPKVKTTAREHLPLEIKLARTARFGKRVLYIAVESPGLVLLQAKLATLLLEIGRVNMHPFTPHITLIQAKRKHTLPEELSGQLNKQVEALLPQRFTVTQLAVFTWMRPGTYRVNSL